MPFIHILAGTGYYFTVPIAALVEIHDLFEYHGGVRTFSFSLEGAFLTFMGTVFFLVGNAIQFQSHVILASLRPNSSSRNFSVPHGGLFRWVSCPHYLAEIIIYLSFLFLTQFQIINLWYVEVSPHDPLQLPLSPPSSLPLSLSNSLYLSFLPFLSCYRALSSYLISVPLGSFLPSWLSHYIKAPSRHTSGISRSSMTTRRSGAPWFLI